MLILKYLKTLQHVSITIQIIIREFVCSLLKSLHLKFNCQRLNVVMRQLIGMQEHMLLHTIQLQHHHI